MTLMPMILAALASSQAADGHGPLKLGAVNLQECFDSDKCEIAKEVNAELKARFAERQKKMADLKKRGQDLKNDLDALPENAHALREDKEKKLAFLITEIKYEEETGKKKYLDYYKNRKVEIYSKITAAVDKVAAEMKLDLVLRMEPPILEDLENESDARRTELAFQRINNRFVLFSTPTVDITAAVVKKLNEDHKKK
ncbi:MAG TPA: OmpH family outer membrane protein [Planctomycetota bacterium]